MKVGELCRDVTSSAHYPDAYRESLKEEREPVPQSRQSVLVGREQRRETKGGPGRGWSRSQPTRVFFFGGRANQRPRVAPQVGAGLKFNDVPDAQARPTGGR